MKNTPFYQKGYPQAIPHLCEGKYDLAGSPSKGAGQPPVQNLNKNPMLLIGFAKENFRGNHLKIFMGTFNE